MELTTNAACIISAGIGGHYGVGIDRLARSLNFVGWGGHTILWKDYPEGCAPHRGEGQYNFKVHAFREAFKRGYTVVIWCDCSIYAVDNPMRMFDYVNEHGLYFFKSGYPLSATATDKLLYYSGVKREDLTDVPEFATGIIGINIATPKGKEFFTRWEQLMVDGMFGGSRSHDPEDSEHPLFKFSRQDQSAASMALHQMGITAAGEDKDWQAYYQPGYHSEKLIFFIQGLG